MPVIERFRLQSAGARALLKSTGVRADLQRRASAVAAVAEPQLVAATAHIHVTDPVLVVADTYIGDNRAGATVIAIHPASLRIEREHRVLGGALDAARG